MRLLVLLLVVVLAWVPGRAHAETRTETLRVPVAAEADGTPVELDATWHLPDDPGPYPAVILAHGFGGSKTDLEGQARAFAAEGYAVLSFTARGFGASGGRIHLNDPEIEGADLRALIDLAARRPDVRLDRSGDPRIGVTGASYGGAVALLAAADDPRIDAIAPIATWSDLGRALFPNHAADAPGPLQQQWIAGFFAATLRDAEGSAPTDATCGRFDPELCHQLLAAAETGRPSPELLSELQRRSPIEAADRLDAPTLLVQGMADSLFGLDQADAMAAALQRTGTQYAVHFTDGGHDAEPSDPDADERAVRAWFDTHLRGAPESVPAFSYPGVRPFRGIAKRFTADHYPGLAGVAVSLPIDAPAAPILTPPGGQPAAITRAPSFGRDESDSPFQAYPLAALPGQSAAFDTADLSEHHSAVGAPVVRLRVTSSAPEVTLFVSLWQVNGATAAQPRRGVAPVRVPVTPGRPTEIAVTLPGGTWSLERGSAWRVLVNSTDAAYANSMVARVDRVQVTALEFPEFTGTQVGTDQPLDPELVGVLIALGVVLVALVAWGFTHHQARVRLPERPELADVPVVVEGLSKAYPDGHRAVTDVSWRAEAGQVVGLLGPNGAGKTTTLRMVLGLIRPDSGGAWVRGVPVLPGAPVLRRVGALVEGPGLLPHLTGRQNLRAYWAATGRPDAEAGFDEALEVAALGGALDRPVKSYSQGMRQRLGIAQAMLGRPDLLILDEPTNGLDPPQIAAMRPILQAYAATGRTVVISSHLLWEVEQTCTHVVVMDAGRVLVSGRVEDLLDGKRHLEELFLSVIDEGRGSGGGPETLTDRLRKVRPR
ncbi:alpha/beta fold hydrolase [Granulicoccus sp. GXG6511]|uniref:alpha/beta fold hydrolase n=1 Tax=Granulicoccus sp. GXG6511 TaxID=3381351 RepID=UPI003D7D562F